MRELKFKDGDVIGNLKIIKKDKVRETKGGAKITQWWCECLLCGSITSKSTQNIQHSKSCGCERYIRGYKVKGSGKQSPKDTDATINCLISIYKSNSKKRNINFNLSYSEVVELINKECFYCGDTYSNTLKKKNYPDLKYNGIDRIDNNIGYEFKNCISCCSECNKMKRNSAVDDFYMRCYRIISRKIELDEKYFNIAKNRIEGGL